jgi:hypothetical protein
VKDNTDVEPHIDCTHPKMMEDEDMPKTYKDPSVWPYKHARAKKQ